jgi:hypothetical protein
MGGERWGARGTVSELDKTAGFVGGKSVTRREVGDIHDRNTSRENGDFLDA